ncbi:pentatricopeptide repeat-containing protein At5g27270 isoform X2 [Diospyros lotus]|uniref:pentatricopeptide repeat-containing protein At5g27270 isoform X2 n=1 Tax=Diospyros lotus TaxID=55363 RepID=UPI0022547391|nr:pentatricopeptide repeat-containing protein At5g27270 isoform X2 [Diospyros lotus]
MEAALSSSFTPTFHAIPYPNPPRNPNPKPTPIFLCSATRPDPWTLSDGNNNNLNKPKPKSKNPKNPLSDDNARRIIKAKAQYLSVLRRNQGSHAQTPKWIKRTPEQMVRYLEDDRNGHLYGKHVVAAIQTVRSLSGKPDGSYDMRRVMGSFVAKLTFKEMCIVLKEQKGWRQARDFFAWMKLQLSYRPSVIVYTILLRIYGQVGKIKLAEQTFLEMLEAGCEPDEVACGTLLCAYARWGRHKSMLSFYSAIEGRGIMLSIPVFNFILSSLQKKSLHGNVIDLWKQMVHKGVLPNHFTYTVVISSFVKEGLPAEAFKVFNEMKNLGLVPEEVTYSLLISLSCKKGNQDEALRLYEDMRLQRIVPSNYTCASLLTLHYKSGDYHKAVSLFSEMERHKIAPDEVIYGLLIRIYGKLGLYEDAQRTFKEIEKLGLLSDEKTYIAMAQVYLSSGACDKALSTMEQMKSRNIWFSRFAYIVLLQCYIMKEDLVSAELMYQALLKTGSPDTGSCNNMLELYTRLSLIEKAKDFVIHIRKDKVKIDPELLKNILKLYCREGMLRDVEHLVEETSASGLFENSKFMQIFYMLMHGESRGYNKVEDSLEHLDQHGALAFELMLSLSLADGKSSKTKEILKLLLKSANGLSVASQLVNKLIKEGNISKAEYLYKLLIELGHIPEHVATASMISFYGKQQKLKQAQKVFEMVGSSPINAKPLYNSMIDAYAKSGQLEAAYLFYKEALEKKQDLGAVAISMLVNALSNGGKYREAEDVIHGSFCNNLDLDTVAYNTFIKAMLEAGKLHSAASLYERMLSSGVIPSIQTYSIMISVHGRGRNLNKAVEMFNVAQTMGVSLDEKAYTNLICYYGKYGKVHEASLLFSKMQDEGIIPGKDFIGKQRNSSKPCRKMISYQTP